MKFDRSYPMTFFTMGV